VLKPALAQTRMGELPTGAHVVPASWPSGHSTAALALVVVAVMAAPPVGRRLVAVVGGLFAAGVGASVAILGWHLPSDALGGFAVAGAVGWAVVAVVWAVDERWPAGAGRWRAARMLAQAGAPKGLTAAVAPSERR
jgi:membrane-associated phospholipid phosphatase